MILPEQASEHTWRKSRSLTMLLITVFASVISAVALVSRRIDLGNVALMVAICCGASINARRPGATQ